MTALARTIVLIVLLTALAGAAGAWVGFQYGLTRVQSNSSLDDVLHHQLGLTAEQENRIGALEAEFAKSRKALEGEMRAANRDLSAALGSEHEYGPQAKQAIERFHLAMGALQEQTIKHILAMRAALTPEQAERFDKTVLEALTAGQP